MPDPDRLLTTLRRATQAYRTTPGRRGRLIRLEDAADVLVAGDLHGNLENFRQILDRAALTQHPRRHLVVQEVVHGPFCYPGGGDKSHQLVDLLAALKCQFPTRVHYLPGNHELAQFTSRQVMKNDVDLNVLFERGIEEAYGKRAPEINAAYSELIFALPLAVRTSNRVFLSHSLPSASRSETFALSTLETDEAPDSEWRPGGGLYSLVWGRDTSEANVEAFLAQVDADYLITGHIPCDHGFEVTGPRHLILDSFSVPAAYCLFPADRALTFDELLEGVKVL